MKVLAMIMVLLLQGIWCSADCWETDRIALLQLQSHLNYSLQHDFYYPILHDFYYDPYLSIYDDSPFSPKIDVIKCCDWERVRCSAITGRVIQLNLMNIRIFSPGTWYLNASLFLPFQHLNHLDLSNNRIADCLKNEGFERLSSLENLEFLNLGSNNFNPDILSSLTHLSSLKYLYLHNNHMKGRINIEELNSLTNLKNLSIGSNEIEGFKSFNGGEEFLLNMTNLQLLDMGYNHIGNDVLSTLRRLSSLKSIWMNNNQLKGPFDLKELDTMSNLEELDLGGNNITKFIGSRGLSSLKTLWMDYNQFEGPFDLKELDTMNNLEELSLSGNNITKFIGSRGMKSMRNLRALYLRGIITINRSSTLLESLGALAHLEILDLSGNNFEGAILSLGAFTNLKTLCMISSNLKGTRFAHGSNLKELYLNGSFMDENFFQSLEALPSLETLSMQDCGLSGIIPVNQGICKLKHLQRLDISYNDFSGNLPLCLANLTSLRQLDISFNHFIGNISSSPLERLTNLEYLSVSRQSFSNPNLIKSIFQPFKTQVHGKYG